jgi:hypothetical protein
MFSLTNAGIECFDLHNRHGGYCGLIVKKPNGEWKAYFNSEATKGSQRRFPTAEAAVAFIRDRRIKKGWRV